MFLRIFLVNLLFTSFVLSQFSEKLFFLDSVLRSFSKSWPEKKLLPEYDFIVVGSGPGGASITNRLSENPKWNILLLEAGGEQIPYSEWPLPVSIFQMTSFNWGYKTEKQNGACLGMINHQCNWPRGKGLGGSSVLNYMIYTRGNQRDYDRWESLGNPGWSFKSVYPYFMKLENMTIPELRDSTYHSTSGPVSVSYNKYNTKVLETFLESSSYINYYSSIDYNTPGNNLGFSRIQTTSKDGKRVSAYSAYLEPIRNRPNLHISINSQVTKVLIDPNTKTAYGVEFIKNGKKRVVRATKEVILSAGAVNTPQILMLSGIGPEKHLKQFGIKVEKNLPVGENLQDHITMAGLSFTHNTTDRLDLDNFFEYFFSLGENTNKGKDMLSIPGGVEGIGYVQTKYNNDPIYPDIEFLICIGSVASDEGLIIRKGIGLTNEIYDKVYKHLEGKKTFTIWPMLLHPQSRGRVKLRSKNPLKSPLMFGNYYDHDTDLKIMVEGIKMAVQLTRTKPFKRIGAELNVIPIPACKHLGVETDAYWACSARQITSTVYHMSGTARMGPVDDPKSVVDHELKVHGIKHLRVVDASIMPILTSAHPTAPIYMIGEKAADMIKEYWFTQENNILKRNVS